MNITIIGTGKLGSTLSTVLQEKKVTHDLLGRKEKYELSGMVYICVPESEIISVSRSIVGADHVLHSSGSVDLAPLRHHSSIGSLHPVMTFPGPDIAIPPPPIPATFSGDDSCLPCARHFSSLVGFSLYPFSGDRVLYHSAAVISGNFSTILLHLAAEILKSEGLAHQQALEILQPLAIQSLHNASKGTIEQVLTGPIARSETGIIEQQISTLEKRHPALAKMYRDFVQAHANILIKKENNIITP